MFPISVCSRALVRIDDDDDDDDDGGGGGDYNDDGV